MIEPSQLAATISRNIEQVIVGKHDEVQRVLVALFSESHVLLEDVPGVGKTMLARSLACSLGCSFKRIQFTPDLLPSDVIGVSIYNQKTSEFEFRPGPVIAQVVLADEINRATPRTQSALLESMEEHQVTVDGVTHHLPEPFIVIATQNPIEYEGTFPLPETQLDRFLVRLSLGYPAPNDEVAVLENQRCEHPISQLSPVATAAEVLEARLAVRTTYVDRLISEYIVQLSTATRNHPDIYVGASPRGSVGLYRASQAYAAISGRDYVTPDDVKAVAVPVLGHRLILNANARMRQVSADEIVTDILDRIPVPGGRVVVR